MDIPVVKWQVKPLDYAFVRGETASIAIGFDVLSGRLDELTAELRGSALDEGLIALDYVSVCRTKVRRTSWLGGTHFRPSEVARQAISSSPEGRQLHFTGLDIEGGPRPSDTYGIGALAIMALLAPRLLYLQELRSSFHIEVHGTCVKCGPGDLRVAICPVGGDLDAMAFGRATIAVEESGSC